MFTVIVLASVVTFIISILAFVAGWVFRSSSYLEERKRQSDLFVQSVEVNTRIGAQYEKVIAAKDSLIETEKMLSANKDATLLRYRSEIKKLRRDMEHLQELIGDDSEDDDSEGDTVEHTHDSKMTASVAMDAISRLDNVRNFVLKDLGTRISTSDTGLILRMIGDAEGGR